ncbi:MAG: aminoglycoside phosphotransferase family protein [Treponema sp.]|nr:aminoglycoside phosphotransferase family protein [Treponema sp.]
MRETIYYQRGMPDPIYDENFVLDIVRKHVPGAKSLKSIDEDGGEGRVYVVDNDIVLKVQRPQQLRSSTGLEKEAFFLNQVEKQTDVHSPRVLGYGKEGTLEYLVMTRIHGIKVEYTKLTLNEKNALLAELGKELRKIHTMDQTPFRSSGLFPCDDPPDLKERIKRRYLSAMLKRKEIIGQKKIDEASAFMDKELANIADTDTDSFAALHVNPYICHIFVDEKTHQYSGLIDYGDSYIGHPVFDMWYWSVISRRKLLKSYTLEKPVSPAFRVIFDTVNVISQKISEILQDCIGTGKIN